MILYYQAYCNFKLEDILLSQIKLPHFTEGSDFSLVIITLANTFTCLLLCYNYLFNQKLRKHYLLVFQRN